MTTPLTPNKLSHLHVTGFRSFLDQEIELRNLNVLIGSNGSGKSSLLDLFEILSRAGQQQLNNAIAERGGIDAVLTWDKPTALFVLMRFAPTGFFIEETHGVDFELLATKQGIGYRIVREIVTKLPALRVLEMTDGRGTAQNMLTGGSGLQSPPNGGELTLAQIRDAQSYPTPDKVRRYLSNIAVYRGFDTYTGAPIRDAAFIGTQYADLPPTRLMDGGDNLTSVLYLMKNDPKYQDAFEEYESALRRAFPAFQELRFPPAGGQGKTILSWKVSTTKRLVEASVLSDGMLRFMCLLAALYDPEPPSLLCIDEPEAGLHPQLLRLLASVIRGASERIQIIITTHSADLLSYLKTPEAVMVVESKNGISELQRLDEERLKGWLEEYTLGELWEQGELGGRQ